MLLKEYYKVLLEQDERVRKSYHDTNNHKQKDLCSNNTVNAVLHNKIEGCQANSIRLEMNLSHFISGKVEDNDWVSLFCSLFDNAIERCQKLEKKEERFITLRSHYRAGYQILNFVCAKQRKPKSYFDVLLLKLNRRTNNLSFDIIREIVKKYKGSIECKEEERIFHIIISLMVETEEDTTATKNM